MAEYSVELQQLQAMADTFIEAEYPYFEELREAFKLLRLTGCRIQEIFDISRWTVISGYNLSFQPQKGNNARYVTLNSEVDNFIAAVQGQYKPFLGRTYSQLQNLFSRINPYGKLYSGTKEITNYFFRYLYVRELWEEGLTVTEIANMMGYTSDQAVSNYLNAVLSSTNEVPTGPPEILPGILDDFVNINGIKISKKPIIWNDGGSGIQENPTNGYNAETVGLYYRGVAVERLKLLLPVNIKVPTEADYATLNSYVISLPNKYANLFTSISGYWPNDIGTNILETNFFPSGYAQGNIFYQMQQFARFYADRNFPSTQFAMTAYYFTGLVYLVERKLKSSPMSVPLRLIKLD